MPDTRSFLEWLHELFFDDAKRAAFEADPRRLLQQAGFDDVSPAEFREGLALVGSEPNVNPALLEQALAATAMAKDDRRDSIAAEGEDPEAATASAGDVGGLLEDPGARLDDLGTQLEDVQPPFSQAEASDEPIDELEAGVAADPFAVEPAEPFAVEPAPSTDPFGLGQPDPFALEGLGDPGDA